MHKHNIGLLGILIVLSFLVHACTFVEEKELYGTYIAKYPFGTEKLILNAVGEYIQEVNITGNPKTIIHKGYWRFAPGDEYVELENGLDVISPLGELNKDYNVPVDGLALCKIMRFTPWGQIRLQSGFEEVQYVKVKQSPKRKNSGDEKRKKLRNKK